MKNKIRNITIIIGLLILISFRLNVACTGLQNINSEEDAVVDVQAADVLPDAIDIPSQYYGSIPTDTGAGTQITLHLDDGTFIEARREAGHYDSFTAVEGVWSSRGDTLFLSGEDGENYATFMVKGAELEMLDSSAADGEVSAAGLYDMNRVPEFDSVSAHHQRLRESGVRFVSSGNEPFWAFRLTGADSGEFSTPESTTETRVQWEDPQESDESGGTLISNETDLRVQIEEELCQDSMSGVLFTHRVSIYYNDLHLTGCGTYL